MDLHRRRPDRHARALAVVVIVAVAGFFAVSIWQYAQHDPPDFIDTPVVTDVAETACAAMNVLVAVRAAPAGAGVETRVRAIRKQDAAVAAMVGRVRRLGEDTLRADLPSESWLSDWESLIAARESYADDLAKDGSAGLRIPASGGVPITERMNDAGLTCQVPAQLVNG